MEGTGCQGVILQLVHGYVNDRTSLSKSFDRFDRVGVVCDVFHTEVASPGVYLRWSLAGGGATGSSHPRHRGGHHGSGT